jgi:hypothetical protein
VCTSDFAKTVVSDAINSFTEQSRINKHIFYLIGSIAVVEEKFHIRRIYPIATAVSKE